jgi:hypothetical protein
MLKAVVQTYAKFASVVEALRGKGEVLFTTVQSTDELYYVDGAKGVMVQCTGTFDSATVLQDFPQAIEVDDLSTPS